MKTKKIFFTFLVFTLLITVFVLNTVSAAAEDELQFKTRIETETAEFTVGETFEVKVSIKDITNETGFVGINIKVDYDPLYLSVIYDTYEPEENEEQSDSYVTFGSIQLPAAWTGNCEKAQNVILDENNAEIGTLVIMCTADLDSENLLESGFTSDDFYVIIPFKCIAACDSTKIKIDTDGDLACTQLAEIDSSIYIIDCLGEGNELVINNIQAAEQSSPTSEGDTGKTGNTLLYILITAGAVIIIGAAVAFILLKKKK
ncbi:MAG: cohesin domain-containing protein [Eubacteriales bacterium]|nr:cohesin domain-containing protein [Eubacteriales bacterium]